MTWTQKKKKKTERPQGAATSSKVSGPKMAELHSSATRENMAEERETNSKPPRKK